MRGRALLLAMFMTACDEDDGPNSQHCIEKRMAWIELDHHKRQLQDPRVAAQTALLQDGIVNQNMKCFPGFVLR